MTAKPRISNLYALLNISPLSDAQTIAQAIAHAREVQSLKPMVLDKAESWLLNPATRAQYDAQLKLQAPEWFVPEMASAATAALTLDADVPPVRLGVLDETIYDGRGDVRVEPDVFLEQDSYTGSYQRHHFLSKVMIYGSIAAVLFSIALVFAWPYLQRTVLAPSDWDKMQLQQHLVQLGWQESAQADYVYLEAAEYTTELALQYQGHELWPVLVNTACSPTPQGLCRIQMEIASRHGGFVKFDEEVLLGFQNDLPLITRAHRKEAIEALQNAREIKVRLEDDGQIPVYLTFTP